MCVYLPARMKRLNPKLEWCLSKSFVCYHLLAQSVDSLAHQYLLQCLLLIAQIRRYEFANACFLIRLFGQNHG